MLYTFPPLPAINPQDGTLVPAGQGQIYAPDNLSTPLTVVDLNGVPMAAVSVSASGLTQAFRVEDHPQVVWVSGSYQVVLVATATLVQIAEDAQAAAEAAQAAAEAAAGGAGGIGYVQVVTGNEARPPQGTVIWLVPPGGPTPTARGPWDPILSVPGDTPVDEQFTGNIALIGDSLIEGMNYTTTFSNTVGRLLSPSGAAPRRYWIPATVDSQVAYAVSSKDWAEVTVDDNGVPWSFFLEPGDNVEWPLTGNPPRVEVFFKRDDGAEANEATVNATSANAVSGSVTGPTTDPSGYGIDSIVIDNPGAWVRLTTTTDRAAVLGVRVFESTAAGGSAVYAFGASGLDSYWFQAKIHEWRLWSNLLARLGVDRVISEVMVNDPATSLNPTQFKDNINSAVGYLTNVGIPHVTGILMPDVGGADFSDYRAALLSSNVTDTIDATGMPLNGTTVGADGAHWTNAGNAAFAAILKSALEGWAP